MERNGVVLGERWSDRIDGFDEFGDLSDGSRDDVHVLAVDDSLVDRKFIEHLLKRSSCKVTVVESGMRALQFLGLDEDKNISSGDFDDLKVDLIITDYCMPGMTGYDLLKKIKESDSFREIPVVIMSSENVLARIDRCLEEGAEEFIMKPVKPSDVKRLKNYTSKDARERNNRVGINKRKLDHSGFDLSASSPSDSVSLSPSPSPSPSFCSSSVSSPSTSLVSSAPCSPSSSESPTRRPKITTCSCL